MDIYILTSGSCGNCTFVRSGDTRLLIDAGLPGSSVARFLGLIGETPDQIDALLLTHEHRDHARGAGVLQRKYGIPVYATAGTLDSAERITRPIPGYAKRIVPAGEEFTIRGISVEAVSTPHDAADPTGFVVAHNGFRLGVFTDFGQSFPSLQTRMPTFDAMLLETNYDEQMLELGPYPPYLKARIRGESGHLSNGDSARMLKRSGSGRLRRVFLSHLSEENNHPDRVYEALRDTLSPDHYQSIDFHLTNRGYPTPMVSL